MMLRTECSLLSLLNIARNLHASYPVHVNLQTALCNIHKDLDIE